MQWGEGELTTPPIDHDPSLPNQLFLKSWPRERIESMPQTSTPVCLFPGSLKPAIATRMTRFKTNDPVFDSEEPLRDHYTPDTLQARDEELDEIAKPLQPVVNGDAPRNVIVHGAEGTGKTVAVRTVLEELEAEVTAIPDVEVTQAFIQCRHLSSTYQLAIRILNTLRDRRDASPVPETGLPKSAIYSRLYEEFDATGGVILLVLDEFDELEKDRDEFLRNLSRALSERTVSESKPGLIITANGYRLIDSLAPETKDSLNAALISFDPYTGDELGAILSARAETAFIDGGVAEGVIPRCAAIAVKQSGSARFACQLLHQAGLLTRDDPDAEQVQASHVDAAQAKVETDHLVTGLAALDVHAHLALVSLVHRSVLQDGNGRTANVYDYYSQVAEKYGFDVLTKRNMQKRLTSMARKGYLTKTTKKDDGNYNLYAVDVDLGIVLQALRSADRDEIVEMAAELESAAEDKRLIAGSQ